MINLTGAIRIAGCAPQPWTALWSVSPNIFRSSTEWQYTASILGHQSNADWRKTETIRKRKSKFAGIICSCYHCGFMVDYFIRNFLRPCRHTLWFPKSSSNVFNSNTKPYICFIIMMNMRQRAHCMSMNWWDCLFSLII